MTSDALAANLAANGSTGLWVAAVPFVAAIVLLLLSPLLVAKIKAVIHGQISDAEKELNVSRVDIPLHLIPECIGDYIEYAADAIQIFPLALLPVTGAIFAIAADVPSVITLVYLGLVIVVAVGADAWVLSQPASKYVARDRFGCSVTTAVGILSNLVGLAMIVFYSP